MFLTFLCATTPKVSYVYLRVLRQVVESIWFAPCWLGNVPLPCSLKMPTKHCWRLCKTSSSVSNPQEWSQLLSIHTFLPANNLFVRKTRRELNKQMFKIKNEWTTGNTENYTIRRDSFWFIACFHCLNMTFKCSTHHSWQPKIILEDIIVLLNVYLKM